MIIHHLGESILDRYGCCDLCEQSVMPTWWEIEPIDRMIFPNTSIKYLCYNCREYCEYKWILHAPTDQLLLAVNYEWCPQRESFPRYAFSIKEIYTRRLSGETFPHFLKFYPIE